MKIYTERLGVLSFENFMPTFSKLVSFLTSVPNCTSKAMDIKSNTRKHPSHAKVPSFRLSRWISSLEVAAPRGSATDKKVNIVRPREPFHWNRNYHGEHIPMEPARSWRVTSLTDDHCLRGRRRDLEVSPRSDVASQLNDPSIAFDRKPTGRL